jgi:hypothetical protein
VVLVQTQVAVWALAYPELAVLVVAVMVLTTVGLRCQLPLVQQTQVLVVVVVTAMLQLLKVRLDKQVAQVS